jgi:hypothetical protein
MRSLLSLGEMAFGSLVQVFLGLDLENMEGMYYYFLSYIGPKFP